MSILKITILSVCLAIGSAAAYASQGDLLPADLRCEDLKTPLGIDVVKPRLNWTFAPTSRFRPIGTGPKTNRLSNSCRFLDEKTCRYEADLWDSGKVPSAQSAYIEYAGKNLQSCQACYWKVRVWDAQDRPAAWSSQSSWSMGLLQPEDWRAKWIGLDTGETMPIFRKEFIIQKPIQRAEVHICGLGQYELRLNGAKVGDNVLDPGWTNYRKSCLYTTYDITSSLLQGKNALGVMLGNGMYNVEKSKRYIKGLWSFGRPKLILQLDIVYADGTKSQVVSDESWKGAPGPIVFSGAYGGEDYDARREPPGWNRPDFTENNTWQPVSIVQGPGGVLVAQMIPPIKVMKTLKPVAPPKAVKDSYLYDLGQNFSGWPRIVVHGPKGATVRLVPGEMISNDQVNQSASGRPAYFQYTLKGDGREEWTPRFSYYGFRWVQVQGACPRRHLRSQGNTCY